MTDKMTAHKLKDRGMGDTWNHPSLCAKPAIRSQCLGHVCAPAWGVLHDAEAGIQSNEILRRESGTKSMDKNVACCKLAAARVSGPIGTFVPSFMVLSMSWLRPGSSKAPWDHLNRISPRQFRCFLVEQTPPLCNLEAKRQVLWLLWEGPCLVDVRHQNAVGYETCTCKICFVCLRTDVLPVLADLRLSSAPKGTGQRTS